MRRAALSLPFPPFIRRSAKIHIQTREGKTPAFFAFWATRWVWFISKLEFSKMLDLPLAQNHIRVLWTIQLTKNGRGANLSSSPFFRLLRYRFPVLRPEEDNLYILFQICY